MNPGQLTITARGDRELAMTRVFAAPRELVFEAWTRPELVVRWLGVHGGWSMDVCEIDLRVGGGYRFGWRGPGDARMGMRGVYREIVRPERLVSTEMFDGSAREAIATMVLVERDGRTTLTMTVRYESKEVRDAMLATRMEQGLAAGFRALDDVLTSLEGSGRC
ncbi:MAG TPA: SRPBCC family protein [Kofleriaceae bacterium]|nr:SRPBCC family protein [Kofleriaceae bacterium]